MDAEAAFWEERGEGAAATLGKLAMIGGLRRFQLNLIDNNSLLRLGYRLVLASETPQGYDHQT